LGFAGEVTKKVNIPNYLNIYPLIKSQLDGIYCAISKVKMQNNKIVNIHWEKGNDGTV